MKSKLLWLIIVLLGLFAVLLAAGKGSRRKLWELDLSTFANHAVEAATQVWGIRFSPDETKLAIGFGPRWNFDNNPRQIVVVAVNQPQVVLRKFDLKIGSPFPSGGNIAWSPSGSIIVIRRPPIMLRFGTEAPCVFPEHSEFGGFLSGDLMVVVLRDRGEIRILAPDCSVGDRWGVDPPADVLDTSPEQGLIAIQRFGKDTSRSAIEVIDASSHGVKQSWKWDSLATFKGGFLFSDQGKLACSANFPKGKRGPDVACWDLLTGSQIAENDKVAVDWHGITGAGKDLLVITDYKYISHQGRLWVFLDMNYDHFVPQRHLIWNVRTGEEVASWGRLGDFYQTELWGRDFERASKTKTPTVLSISTSGKYVAEGGSGSVSVHVLEP